MKIVFITAFPERKQKHISNTGVASYTKNLISTLPLSPQDTVYVLCHKIHGKEERYQDGNVNIIRCFEKNKNFIAPIIKEIKMINPDVIHVQQERALFGGIITSFFQQWLFYLLRSYQIITTLHGVVSLKKITKDFVKENRVDMPTFLVKYAFYFIYKPICKWSTKIIVHEQYFKDILNEEYGISKNKIEVIYHGVEDLKTYSKKEACKKLKLKDDVTYILFMGYLTGYKGIDLLIESYSEFARSYPNVCLLIGAGEHPDQKNSPTYALEYLRLFIKAKNLLQDSQYKWIGFIKEKDIKDYFSVSDVTLYPYTIAMASSGPMSMSIGYKVPFIASDVFQNVFSPRVLFERNAESFSQKLNDIIENKSFYKNEIAKMREERLWRTVSQQTYNLYEKTIKKRA